MNEIMEKTYELIDILDESELIKNIEKYRDQIMKDEELCKLVKQANESENEYLIMDIKKRLYQNDTYKNYMDNYNQLMYYVMDINYRYNKLLGKGSCYKCG